MFVTNKFGSVDLSAMPPVSRRERPAKPALSLEAIVAAALRLMETEATERLTMRRLATELDTGPASLYVYVKNTAELYAHVLDSRLGELDLDWDPAVTPWLERLTTLLLGYYELLKRSPALSRSAMFSRPSGENYLGVVELLLRLLTQGGGATHARAAWGIDVLLQVATAGAVEHGARAASASEVQGLDDLTAAVEHADPVRFPLIAAIGLDLMSGPGRVRWSFEALANGIVATPRPTE